MNISVLATELNKAIFIMHELFGTNRSYEKAKNFSEKHWKTCYWKRELTLLNVKSYYVATVIKLIWFWWKDSHIDYWNRTENPEIEPHKCFYKDSREIR